MRTINKDLLKSKINLTSDKGNGGKLPMLTKSKIVDQRNNLFIKSFQSNQDLLASSQRLDRSIERAGLRDSAIKLDQSNSNIVLEKKNRKSLGPEKFEMNPISNKSRLDSLHGPKAEKPCRTFL
jgi:ABC-type Fe3+/spermidine/putrescine transport system ATPase subunit